MVLVAYPRTGLWWMRVKLKIEELKVMKKILAFFLLVLAFVGVVGGIGYTCYYNAWPIAVGITVTGWMAWPKVMKAFQNLTS